MITPNYYQNPNMMQMSNMYQQPYQQQNAFITVRSEEEARNYPVAVGNSVTFRNENEPYCYTKTMGFSQLDRPVFEKYRMIKEEPIEMSTKPDELSVIRKELDEVKAEVEKLKGLRGERNDKSTDVKFDDGYDE